MFFPHVLDFCPVLAASRISAGDDAPTYLFFDDVIWVVEYKQKTGSEPAKMVVVDVTKYDKAFPWLDMKAPDAVLLVISNSGSPTLEFFKGQRLNKV